MAREFHLDSSTKLTMNSGNASGFSEKYIHDLASEIANQLNRSVVNDNLARQVVNFAEKLPDSKAFVQACQAFGKFNEAFLLRVYNKVRDEKKGSLIKVEFEGNLSNASSSSKLSGMLEKGGLILPPKREVSPSSETKYSPSIRKSKYGLDHLAKKIKLENEETIKLEYEPESKPSKEIKSNEDRKVSFRKVSNISQHTKKERNNDLPDNTNERLNKLSSSARERLEIIRAKRNQQSSQASTVRNSTHESIHSSKQYQRSHSRPISNKSDSYRSRRPDLVDKDEIDTQPGNDELDGESQAALDRDWYLGDEFGHTAGDDSHNPFGEGLYDEQQEEQLRQKMNTRMSNIARQKQKESDMWEQNQMMTSGVKQQGYVDTDFDDENENRIHLFVHNLRPPFLDGQQVFTRQKDPISAVLDPQSDMAIFAKKGSALVRDRRQKREREKQAKDAASMAGTTLGNVLGVKETSEDEDEETGKSASNKFADHLKTKQEGSSEFSKNLSVKEQRQFLPAFAVREDLLKVIRDNQGKFFFLYFG